METSQSLVDIPMQDAYIEDHHDAHIEDCTPKPKKNKNTRRFESEDGNSQIETEDDEYETPKALQKRAPATLPDSSSDSDSVGIVDSLADPEPEWKGKNALNTESDDGSDIYEPQKKEKGKLGNKNKTSTRNHGDVQGSNLKTIDLAKMQKKAKGKKDKKAFRKEVEERRAVTSKKERKVC